MENYGYCAGEIECLVATATGGRSILQENAILRDVLKRIANWELPETGQYWDNERTRPMSYAAAYGSDGEQAYIREIALQALER